MLNECLMLEAREDKDTDQPDGYQDRDTRDKAGISAGELEAAAKVTESYAAAVAAHLERLNPS